MPYLSAKNKSFTPVSNVKIGDKVCYRNGNGNWYQGVVEKSEDSHPCLLAPRNKRGVIVNYGEISLIQNVKDLFTFKRSGEVKSK